MNDCLQERLLIHSHAQVKKIKRNCKRTDQHRLLSSSSQEAYLRETGLCERPKDNHFVFTINKATNAIVFCQSVACFQFPLNKYAAHAFTTKRTQGHTSGTTVLAQGLKPSHQSLQRAKAPPCLNQNARARKQRFVRVVTTSQHVHQYSSCLFLPLFAYRIPQSFNFRVYPVSRQSVQDRRAAQPRAERRCGHPEHRQHARRYRPRLPTWTTRPSTHARKRTLVAQFSPN